MKKTLNHDQSPLSKRKSSRYHRSVESEAEEEADEKWRTKRIKTEPGSAGRQSSTTRPRPKSTSAAEALRKRRQAGSTAASTPRTSTPPKGENQSVVDFALKALAELPLDGRFVADAVKTFAEDHFLAILPPGPWTLHSQVPSVTQHLQQRQVDAARIQEVTGRLREAEAEAMASWLGARITDRETLRNTCRKILDAVRPPGAGSVETPRAETANGIRSSLTSSSRGGGEAKLSR